MKEIIMTYIINPSRFVVAGGGNLPTRSIDFEESSSQYLSMSHSDWGSYDRAKFAIAGSFYMETAGTEKCLISKDVNNASNEWHLVVGSSNNIIFTSNDGSAFFIGPSSVFSVATWYSFLVHFDSANSTSADRVKVWVNNSLVIASSYGAPSGAVSSVSTDVNVGRRQVFGGIGHFDGLIFSLAFFDGVLPAASAVFDGSAGKLKDLSGISGLHSLLDVAGGSVVSDYVKAADWTNHGSVTSSTSVP